MTANKHSTNTAPTAAKQLGAEARARLEKRYPHFGEMPKAEQDAAIRCEARLLAIARSPIGRRAAAIEQALTNLIDAIEEFLQPGIGEDDATADAAVAAALVAAGLDPVSEDLTLPERYSWGVDCFHRAPAELRGWTHALEVLRERLEDCGLTNDLREADDSQAEQRPAVAAAAA
jgi:hypothetical protein